MLLRCVRSRAQVASKTTATASPPSRAGYPIWPNVSNPGFIGVDGITWSILNLFFHGVAFARLVSAGGDDPPRGGRAGRQAGSHGPAPCNQLVSWSAGRPAVPRRHVCTASWRPGAAAAARCLPTASLPACTATPCAALHAPHARARVGGPLIWPGATLEAHPEPLTLATGQSRRHPLLAPLQVWDERRVRFRDPSHERLWRFFYRRSGMGRWGAWGKGGLRPARRAADVRFEPLSHQRACLQVCLQINQTNQQSNNQSQSTCLPGWNSKRRSNEPPVRRFARET